jgi:ElaB/YqjD/DUF883 family membrane-anchored ribosome-binding protein
MTTTNQTGSLPHDHVSRGVHDADEQLAALGDRVAKRVDSLASLMKDHPFAALGIGLGVGYLLARLLHR